MLSRELGTHLTGRHISSELYSLYYHEFLAFNNLDNTIERFDNYLLTGGMPEFYKQEMGCKSKSAFPLGADYCFPI